MIYVCVCECKAWYLLAQVSCWHTRIMAYTHTCFTRICVCVMHDTCACVPTRHTRVHLCQWSHARHSRLLSTLTRTSEREREWVGSRSRGGGRLVQKTECPRLHLCVRGVSSKLPLPITLDWYEKRPTKETYIYEKRPTYKAALPPLRPPFTNHSIHTAPSPAIHKNT